ncbi:hypothetical protein ACFWPH_28170 [Nocardia sp. NPDC058499]|uniref:hypothetical protein n=1 Tax=Nocardia sp. NPDC058499 TaxID=3346530 RepID=UPI003656D265
MRRRVLAIVLAALCCGLCTGTVAHAAPTDPSNNAPARTSMLPSGFPDELKQFIGGSDEFRAGPWFTGACSDRGGDLGTYINAVFAVEDQLLYWTADDEQKTAMLRGAMLGAPGTALDAEAQAAQIVEQGQKPPEQFLPRVFPKGDAAYSMRTPYCADDLKRWATPSWNTWGLEWAATPDRQSMNDIRNAAGFDTVPEQAWTDPCGGEVEEIYCNRAFFVDCEQADPSPDDLRRCIAWNRSVAQLFIGTAQWIDANTSFSDRLDAAFGVAFAAGAAYVNAFAWVWGTAVPTVVAFVADPQSVIDDWAISSKEGAVQLSTEVLTGLSGVGGFDPAAPWFLRWYAMSTGLGIVVMALMTILALWRASAKGETVKSIAGDLLGYAPAGVVMMLFAPLLAQMLVELSNALSESITRASGPDMGEMVNNLTTFTGELTAPGLPGGAIVGLFLFLLLIAGALGVFFGLLMHANALPILAVAAGIGFGMWVHPKWRPKALRPVLVFIGIVFSKPLLFFLLAVQTGVINAELTGEAATEGDTGTLGKLCMIVVSFLVVGLAPWSLVKYAPLLPTRADASGFGAHSGSLMAGALGGVASSHMWYRFGGGQRDRGDRKDRGGTGGTARGGTGGGGGDPGPAWRTAGRGDGRSGTEARFGDMLQRRSGGAGGGGAAKSAGSGGKKAALGKALRVGGTAASLAIPAAAQASAAALNKARSAAEATPGEAEQQQ